MPKMGSSTASAIKITRVPPPAYIRKKRNPTIRDLFRGTCFRFQHPIDYDNIYQKNDKASYQHLNTGKVYYNSLDREVVVVAGSFTYYDIDSSRDDLSKEEFLALGYNR